jgi:hypothetical protein
MLKHRERSREGSVLTEVEGLDMRSRSCVEESQKIEYWTLDIGCWMFARQRAMGL